MGRTASATCLCLDGAHAPGPSPERVVASDLELGVFSAFQLDLVQVDGFSVRAKGCDVASVDSGRISRLAEFDARRAGSGRHEAEPVAILGSGHRDHPNVSNGDGLVSACPATVATSSVAGAILVAVPGTVVLVILAVAAPAGIPGVVAVTLGRVFFV